jgi:large subunit ribosomal protein L9
MKVILTQELKGRGHEGDVIEVARGYAANYLLPRKMAIEATAGNLKQLESKRSNIDRRNAARRTDAEGIAAALDGKTVVIQAKAGDEGKLFGSVTGFMVEEAVKSQLGPDVDHRRMDLNRPIKTIGEHHVTVTVFGDVKADIIVKVVPEGGTVERVAQTPPAEPPVSDSEAAEAVAEETGETRAVEESGEQPETETPEDAE